MTFKGLSIYSFKQATSNVTIAPTHALPGSDSVRLPYETESHTNTPGLAGAPQVASPNSTWSYSKRPSRNKFFPLLIYVNFVSLLPDLRWGWSYSLEDTCCSQWSFPRAHQIYICAAASHRKSGKRQHYKGGEHQRPWKDYSLPYTIQQISHYHSQRYWLRILSTGTTSARCKDVGIRTKRLGVRWEGWICEFCRAYNAFGDPNLVRPFKNFPQLFETFQLLREVYYQLYSEGYEMPFKAANDREEPSIGRIQADSIASPHSPTTIKLCILRVERNPGIVNSDLYADTTCDTPLKEGHISILRTDGPGLNPGVDKSRHTHTQMRCDTQQEERHIILMSDTLMPSAGLLFPKASEGVSNLIIVVCRIS